jgi:hypothetical protein
MITRGEAERRIRERAASDSAFLARLKDDPRAALEAEFEIPIPADVQIHVHEETMRDFHLVIPASQESLTDEELELVAGGGGCYADCPDDIGASAP